MDQVEIPKLLTVGNLGMPIKIRIYENYGEEIDTSVFEQYIGRLEGFYYNKDGMIIKLHGFAQIVTRWDTHHVMAD